MLTQLEPILRGPRSGLAHGGVAPGCNAARRVPCPGHRAPHAWVRGRPLCRCRPNMARYGRSTQARPRVGLSCYSMMGALLLYRIKGRPPPSQHCLLWLTITMRIMSGNIYHVMWQRIPLAGGRRYKMIKRPLNHPFKAVKFDTWQKWRERNQRDFWVTLGRDKGTQHLLKGRGCASFSMHPSFWLIDGVYRKYFAFVISNNALDTGCNCQHKTCSFESYILTEKNEREFFWHD